MCATKVIPVTFTLETDGSGLWTEEKKEVDVTDFVLLAYDDDEYGELRVYFDTDTWDNTYDGLIYTDKQFMDDLRGCLEVLGLDDSDVEYSEQGMQGRNYVSCDAGSKFLASWAFKEWSESELVGK